MTAWADIAFVVVESLLVIFILTGLCSCGEPERENNADGRAPARVAAAAAAAPAPAPASVAKLPGFPYAEKDRRPNEKVACAICLEFFIHGDLCSEVPACRHFFHSECVEVWMKSNNTCPLCRGVIVTESEDSERGSAADDMA